MFKTVKTFCKHKRNECNDIKSFLNVSIGSKMSLITLPRFIYYVNIKVSETFFKQIGQLSEIAFN